MEHEPWFDGPPSIINKPDGSVLFECMLKADPQPEIKWYFKDQEVSGDRYVVKTKKQVGKFITTLLVKNPKDSDQGVYKVIAKNSAGQGSVEQAYVRKCTANSVFKEVQSYG